MPSRRARQLLAASATTLLLSASACVATATPALLACDAGAERGPTGGSLTVIPSLVPGVEIERASWRTWASTMDIGAQQGVSYHATLKSTRAEADTDYVVIYEARPRSGPPRLTMDNMMVIDGGTVVRPLGRDARLHATGVSQSITKAIIVESGVKTGKTSPMQQCPRNVRIVPRRELVLYLRPGVSVTQDPDDVIATLRANYAGRDTNVVRIIATIGADSSLFHFGALVENTADTVVTDVVAALAIAHTAEQMKYHQWKPAQDTIEFLIPRMGPHELVRVSGGYSWGEKVVATLAYPAASVRGRKIADDRVLHRVSAVAREGPAPR